MQPKVHIDVMINMNAILTRTVAFVFAFNHIYVFTPQRRIYNTFMAKALAPDMVASDNLCRANVSCQPNQPRENFIITILEQDEDLNLENSLVVWIDGLWSLRGLALNILKNLG